MTQRERKLMLVLAGILGAAACVYFLNRWYLAPLRDYNQQIESLDDEVSMKEMQVMDLQAEVLRLDKAKVQSMHANPELAALEYTKYLKKVLAESGLKIETFEPPPRFDHRALDAKKDKKALHVILPFKIRAEGTLSSVAKLLETLQRTPVLHRVLSLKLDRTDSGNLKETNPNLRAQMTVEALVLNGAYTKAEPKLKADPKVKINEGNTSRQFADLSKRNPFTGPVPPPPETKVAKKDEPEPEPEPGVDERLYVRLVQTDPVNDEAFLRHRGFTVRTPEIRIKSEPMSGYDTFRIINEERKPILRGKVLRIDQRDVYFQVGEDVYGIHIGQNLAEAMRRPLNEEEMTDLDLAERYNLEEAKQGNKDKKDNNDKKTTSKGGTTKKGL